jgi:predicted enzyme related to lactoylglutathione lyase
MDAPVVHFEIPAKNPETLSGFYTGIFGWKIEKVPGMDYWMVNTKSAQEAPGINGGLMKKMHDNHTPTNYIDVKSVDEWSKKVTSAGGTIAVSKSPVPGMGYFAVCFDPEGNVFGLWQNDPTAK